MTSTPRRLTREQQRARTRRELLEAAARVFAQRGFHASSVDDVAEAAGYTKGAVYSNFSSKEELFLALFEQSVRDTVSVIDEILQSPPEDRIAELGARRDAVAFFSPEWQMLEMEFALYVARNPHLQPRMAQRQRELRSQVAARIEQHLADTGATSRFAAADLARLLGAAGDGLTMQQISEGEPSEEVGRLFSILLQVVFAGATRRDG